MLGWQAELESAYGHIVKVTINLVEHFPISVRIGFQGFSFFHGQRQQKSQRPRDPAVGDKTGSKRLSEFLEGINGVCPQTIKPPHRHWPQTGREHFAHQRLVLGVYSHLLIEVANMLHRVCSAIIHNEGGL